MSVPRREVCPSCGVGEGIFHRPGCSASALPVYKSEPMDVLKMEDRPIHIDNPVLDSLKDAPRQITVSIPKEVEPYAQDIRRFVEAMVYKLSVHSSKGRWENRPIADVLDALEGEVKELRDAVQRGNMVEILLEAADVGNYGLIASAIAVERGR